MIYHDVIQGTDEWFALRCGKFTSSTFGDLFMKETTKGYQEAINRVVFEKISGESPETYSNDFMKRGSELEPLARQAYELETFTKVKQIGFIEYDEWIGGSPDGLIGKDGILEIKCPKWNTLIGYILDDIIPKEYVYQMQGNLFVSDRKWCDFYVWHPKFQPILKRVKRDEMMIADIQSKLKEVVEEAKTRILRITGNEFESIVPVESFFDKNKFLKAIDELNKKIPPIEAELFRNNFYNFNHYSVDGINERSGAEFYYKELSTYVTNFLKDFNK